MIVHNQHPSLSSHSPTVASHDLKNEAALMGVGSSSDGVHGLDDAVEGGVSANGHVGATEVIVDGAHHANNVQVGVKLALLLRNLACGNALSIYLFCMTYSFICW